MEAAAARWVERASALASELAGRAADVDRSGAFPAENVTALRDAGFLGAAVPASLGGAGLTLAACCDVLFELARGDGGTSLGLAMHLMVTGSAARRRAGWPPDVYAALARAAAGGTAVVNNVASEPALGSPARGGMPETTATRVDGGFVVDGTKTWATWLPALTHAVVSATLDEGDADGRRLLQLLVPLDLPGVRRVAGEPGVGLRSAGNGTLVLDAVRMPSSAVLHARAADDRDPRGAVLPAWFRLTTSAVYAGIAAAARDAVAEFCRERRPNRRAEPIAAIPAVRLRLGGIDAQVRAARLLIDAAAARVDSADGGAAGAGGEGAGADPVAAVLPDVGVAKVAATQLAWRACEDALRLAGGSALQGDTLPLERLARDVRGGLVHPPTEDGLHDELGRDLASR